MNVELQYTSFFICWI